LVADAIRVCSHRGHLVLGSFGGSGTTLIACEKKQRKARLIEIDPAYCDLIIRRWRSLLAKTPRMPRPAVRSTLLASAKTPQVSHEPEPQIFRIKARLHRWIWQASPFKPV